MDGFRYNPSAGSSGGNLKVLPPEEYNNQNITSVELILPNGQVIDRGRYMRMADGRKNYRFSKPGWAYPSNVRVRVVTSGGKSEIFNPSDGIKSGERGPGGAPMGGRGEDDFEDQDEGDGEGDFGGGSSGSVQEGEDFDTFESAGGNTVAIPNFVDFNPEEYFISLDEAINAGRAEGEFNLDLFNRNFQRSKGYALDTQQTELEGLESFLPRTSNLIRRADAQGNQDILAYSDVFDARNERASRKATQGNVALREDTFESRFPGTFDAVRGMRTRAEGDVRRVRSRESTSFVDDVMKEQAARKARGIGADVASSIGFGADSSAGMQLIDTLDVDKRLQIEQAKREDFRRGDSAIYAAEGQVGNAVIQSENLFNTVIAPGIRDFTPLQAVPRVTDIGAQIRPMPAVDAGTLQREFTSQQNAVSMLAPSQVFSGSLSTQQYNSGVGLQALGFQQEQFNTVAGAANTGINQDKADDVFNQQLEAFEQGLEAREDSQNTQGITSAITGGLGVLGGLANTVFGGSGSQGSGGGGGQNGGGGGGGLVQGAADLYNTASDFLNDTFGFGIGHISTASNSDTGGGGGFGGGSGGGGSGGSGWDIFGSGGPPPGVIVDSFPTASDTTFGGQSAADHNAAQQGIENYFNGITQNDFQPDALTDPNFDMGSDTFVWDETTQGYQVDNYSLDSSDTFAYDGGLDTHSDNEYVNLARVSKSSSGVEVIPKNEIVKSFTDPNIRTAVMQKAPDKGIPISTIMQGYALFDNWNSMSPKDRAFASAQFATNLADNIGVIEGAIPGAVINTLRQGATLFENWDNLTESQKIRAGTQFIGGISSLASSMAGVGGPIGMGITFAAGAYGNAAAVAMNGIKGIRDFTAVATPLSSHGVNLANAALGNRFHQKDAAHASLFMDPTGIGTAVAAADMLFGLDLDFSSGKPKTQQFRDNLRSYLRNNNVISPNYQWRMSDGSVFDIGKDGGAKLKNIGRNIDGKTERQYSDVDHSNPIAPQTTAWADVTAILGFRSKEGKRFTGNLWNAATNADPTNLEQAKDNFKGMAHDMGLDYNKGIKILEAMKDQFSAEDYAAYRNSWQTLNLK